MADSDGVIKLAFYMIGGGGVSLFTGLKRLRKLRQIEDTPRSEIRSAAQGLVEIEGHALPYKDEYRNSDGKKVVYHSIRFQKRVSRGKNSSWDTIYEETSGDSFIVSDGTGITQVFVAKADLLLTDVTREWSNIPAEDKEAVWARYRTKVPGLPMGPHGFFSFKPRFRIIESSLLVGAPVYVRGSFQTSQGAAAYLISPLHFRFLEKLIQLKKEPTGRAKAFDLNRDGKIEEIELRVGSEKLLYKSKSAVLPEDKPEAVAIQGSFHHDSTHGLTIGDAHQNHLTLKLSTWNSIRIIGGALLIAGGFGVAVQQFVTS